MKRAKAIDAPRVRGLGPQCGHTASSLPPRRSIDSDISLASSPSLTAIVRAWTLIVAVVIYNLLAERDGLLWGYGLPVGHDFHIFYTAARAAADGRLAEIFFPERLWAMAQEYLGVAFATNGLWLYPPYDSDIERPTSRLPLR